MDNTNYESNETANFQYCIKKKNKFINTLNIRENTKRGKYQRRQSIRPYHQDIINNEDETASMARKKKGEKKRERKRKTTSLETMKLS